MVVFCETILPNPQPTKYRQHLVVMVKYPNAGRVKTRLGRDIGRVAAAWWFRHQVARLLREIRDPRWHIILAVSPDNAMRARGWPRQWPGDIARIPQGRGDLGARMVRAMTGVATGVTAGPVCLIGGDIPGVRKHHIARAFKALGENDAVFGPAPDGGYWLVGVGRKRAIPPGFLCDVRWSTEHALRDSEATYPGARIARVDVLRDVDRADDLAFFVNQ